MIYSAEVQNMCSVAKGAYHGPAPIPEEGKWVQAKEIKDISGFTHGIGWCAPQQGACKLTLYPIVSSRSFRTGGRASQRARLCFLFAIFRILIWISPIRQLTISPAACIIYPEICVSGS